MARKATDHLRDVLEAIEAISDYTRKRQGWAEASKALAESGQDRLV